MLPVMINHYPIRTLKMLGFTALAALVVQLFASIPAFASDRKSSSKLKPIPTFATLDQDANQFEVQTALIRNARECFPVHIRDQAKIGIMYLYCSDDAFETDSHSVEITTNFTVPQGIARRYNFWRRVYSLWSKDQYVLHIANYPEVVLEVFDIARIAPEMSGLEQERFTRSLAKSQRSEYRRLLLALHAHRNRQISELSPSMQRVARAMRHIDDSQKYLKAATGLRVQRGQRDFIAKGLTVGPKYLPYIEQEFEAQGIHPEIAQLAYIESSFNLLARSKVGASGVFQIMPETGRQYLTMTDGIDERNDPIKASRAAAKLLRFNYQTLGSWPLAITAYNHGAGGLKKAIRATGSRDLIYLVNNYQSKSFQFASSNFYAGFLGLMATLKESDRIFPEVPKVEALKFNSVRLTSYTSINTLKKRYNLTNDDIAVLNPDMTRAFIRSGGNLPRGYVIKVPAKEKNSIAMLTGHE